MPTLLIPRQGEIEGVNVPLRSFCNDERCKESSVIAYIGIPYAQPPVGNLRWKRPQGLPSWQGIRKSTWQCDPVQDLPRQEFFSKPRKKISLALSDDDEEDRKRISEDCLYLNVWKPYTESSDKFPVVAWVYGGAFITGSTSLPVYDGARLANESGCLVVSIAYRVGVFGWLGSKELSRREETEGCGNYGAWDVVAALQWLHTNASIFNGDADNITLFGESAGSILIHDLILSPKVPKDLFARAILNSGTALTKPARSMESAQATFDALLLKAGGSLSMSDGEKVDLLCKVKTDDLFKMTNQLPAYQPRTEYRVAENEGRPALRAEAEVVQMEAQNTFGPIWDGVFIDEDFLKIAMHGLPSGPRNAAKGIMLSYNIDEGSMFAMLLQSVKTLQHHVNHFHPHLVDSLKRLYKVESVRNSGEALAAASAMAGDEYFQVPVRSLMMTLAKQSEIPSYGYIFAHRPSAQSLQSHFSSKDTASLGETLAAAHSFELPFIFGNDGTEKHIFAREDYSAANTGLSPKRIDEGFTDEELKMSLSLMRSVANFARGQAPWKALNGNVDRIQDLRVLSIGTVSQIGSESASSYDPSKEILVQEGRLGDHAHWKETVLSIGTIEERQAYWSEDNFKNLFLSYYGNEKMHFTPCM